MELMVSGTVARSTKTSPFDAGGDAELILLGVRHSDPLGSPEALHTLVDAMSPEYLQPVDLDFDVVGHDVEMHRFLPALGSGTPWRRRGEAIRSLGTSTAKFASV